MAEFSKSDEEKVKLRATWFNNMGVAAFGAGAIASALSIALRAGSWDQFPLAIFLIAFFTAFSGVLHYVGFRTLERISKCDPIPPFKQELAEFKEKYLSRNKQAANVATVELEVPPTVADTASIEPKITPPVS